MHRVWIIDVLADLRRYAEMNGLPATAASLEDATLIALAEAGTASARGRSGTGQGAAPGEAGEAGKTLPVLPRRDLL